MKESKPWSYEVMMHLYLSPPHQPMSSGDISPKLLGSIDTTDTVPHPPTND